MTVLVLSGDGKLNRRLKELGGPKAKKAVRKASRTALKPVRIKAQQLAPKRSGYLRRSIKVRALKRSRVRIGSRVTTGKDSGAASGGKGGNFNGRAFYGGFQEYGWRIGKRKTNVDIGLTKGATRTDEQRKTLRKWNKRRRKIRGKRYMKRAADSKREVALRIYRRETTKWVYRLSRVQ